LSLIPLKIWAEEDAELRLIHVTGDADVKVVPDEVVITLGIQIWDGDLDVAKKQHDERTRKSLNVIKSFGIDPKYIQTEYISISPTYKDYPEHYDINGYTVSKTIVVTLKEISKFENLLSSVLKSGVNYLHNIQFRTTELRKYRDQARSLAIKAAKEKAIALASELGQKIGEPHSITEQHSGWSSWYGYSGWWGSNRGGMSQNVVQNVGGESVSDESTMSPGQITVNARVTVSFELR